MLTRLTERVLRIGEGTTQSKVKQHIKNFFKKSKFPS